MFLRLFITIILFISPSFFYSNCRNGGSSGNGGGSVITIANSDKFSGLDTLSTNTPDSAADRIRNLIFNSLVKKNDKFEYVGDLAKDFKIAPDNLTVTFTLQDNIKFHNGKDFTATDAKYTLDALFQSGGYKAASFFDTVNNQKQPHIVSIETPDAKTLVIKVARPALVNQLLSNLVAIPIIPEGTIGQQKDTPIGTGAFKFTRFDQVNSLVEMEANPNYWEGAPKIPKLVVKTVTDANALQAELQSGRVDIAPNPTNFSADTYNTLGKTSNLQVVQSDGSNVRYLGFNISQPPINNVKLRQAIAYAVDREKIIKDLLQGQAKVAHSILPAGSWAYNAGTQYNFDQNKARQLVQESGYKGEQIKFKIAAGNTAVSQYAQLIRQALLDVGINSELDQIENNTLLEQLRLGQFQMNTSIWIGGNQDPIFLRDLFASSEFPEKKPGGRNRSRYANADFDKLVQEAVDSTEKTKATELYGKAQQIVSDELPLFPLWYPSNMVVANKRIGNIKINASGDWSFVKDLTVNN